MRFLRSPRDCVRGLAHKKVFRIRLLGATAYCRYYVPKDCRRFPPYRSPRALQTEAVSTQKRGCSPKKGLWHPSLKSDPSPIVWRTPISWEYSGNTLGMKTYWRASVHYLPLYLSKLFQLIGQLVNNTTVVLLQQYASFVANPNTSSPTVIAVVHRRPKRGG